MAKKKKSLLDWIPYYSFLEIDTWQGIALIHVIMAAVTIFFALGGKNFQLVITMFGLTAVSLFLMITFSKNIEKSKFKVRFSLNTHDMFISLAISMVFAVLLISAQGSHLSMATPVFSQTTAASEFTIKYPIPFLEEVVFRGGIFGTMAAMYPPPVAMVVSSATFSGFHYFSYGEVMDPVTGITRAATTAERMSKGFAAFAFGLFSTVIVFLRRGNLLISILPHCINNILAFAVPQVIFVFATVAGV